MIIKIFSTEQCRYCTQLKDALVARGIEFTEVTDMNQMVIYGVMSAPTTIIEDNEGTEVARFVGFNSQILGKILGALE